MWLPSCQVQRYGWKTNSGSTLTKLHSGILCLVKNRNKGDSGISSCLSCPQMKPVTTTEKFPSTSRLSPLSSHGCGLWTTACAPRYVCTLKMASHWQHIGQGTLSAVTPPWQSWSIQETEILCPRVAHILLGAGWWGGKGKQRYSATRKITCSEWGFWNVVLKGLQSRIAQCYFYEQPSLYPLNPEHIPAIHTAT